MTATFVLPEDLNGRAISSTMDWHGVLKTGPASVSIERELAVELSLGIRDNSKIASHWSSTLPPVEFPLAFRVKNTGKRTIGDRYTSSLFTKGITHVMPKGGNEEQSPLAIMWMGMVQDLLPGKTLECGIHADPVGLFRNLKDGDYQIWWTLGVHKSNSLHFIIKNGKALLEPNDPNAPPLPAPPPNLGPGDPFR